MESALLDINLTLIQVYGIIFLLGSLTVASLSDLRRMAAQKDFAEVWIIFSALGLLYDLARIVYSEFGLLSFCLKWAVIAAIGYLAYSPRISFMSLSFMDVAAIVAVNSMLNPALIVGFLVVLIISSEFMSPIMRSYGSMEAYPFLPIILFSTVIIFCFSQLAKADIEVLHISF
ncbi:MAG: hypothetical protein ABH950_05750 [Candidatus Altiarchaeota archaeon]